MTEILTYAMMLCMSMGGLTCYDFVKSYKPTSMLEAQCLIKGFDSPEQPLMDACPDYYYLNEKTKSRVKKYNAYKCKQWALPEEIDSYEKLYKYSDKRPRRCTGK